MRSRGTLTRVVEEGVHKGAVLEGGAHGGDVLEVAVQEGGFDEGDGLELHTDEPGGGVTVDPCNNWRTGGCVVIKSYHLII